MPPLVEAGIKGQDGNTDPVQLVHVGPSLKVHIGHFRSSEDTTPLPKDDVLAAALVDTGAAQSCIDTRIAQSLELPIVDKMTISGVGGPRKHDVYLAQIHIPDLNFTQYGLFAGVELTAGGQYQSALLGRTFLNNTIMIYDGFRGQVTITVS